MLPFLQRLSATLTAAAVALHLLYGCCCVVHAQSIAESHAVAADHECEHHHGSHSDHDDEPCQGEPCKGEPCRQHCSTNCAPATLDRHDVAVPAPLAVAAVLPVAPVAEFASPVRLVEPSHLPAPPQSLVVLHCALRN